MQKKESYDKVLNDFYNIDKPNCKKKRQLNFSISKIIKKINWFVGGVLSMYWICYIIFIIRWFYV